LFIFDTLIKIYSVSVFKIFFLEFIDTYNKVFIKDFFRIHTGGLIDIYMCLLLNIFNIYIELLTCLDEIGGHIKQFVFVKNVIHCDSPRSWAHFYNPKHSYLYKFIVINKSVLNSDVYLAYILIIKTTFTHQMYLCTENPTGAEAGTGPGAGAVVEAGTGPGAGGKIPDNTENTKLPENLKKPSPYGVEKTPKNSEQPTAGKAQESKCKELEKLRDNRVEFVKELQVHNNMLRKIESAESLDNNLPDKSKDKNGYVMAIKEDYPAFFDEDSGNSSIKESLKDVKEYIRSEKYVLMSEIKKLDSKVKDLNIDSKDNKESSKNLLKRDEPSSDADTHSKPSAKKIYIKDDGDDNNRPGTSS